MFTGSNHGQVHVTTLFFSPEQVPPGNSSNERSANFFASPACLPVIVTLVLLLVPELSPIVPSTPTVILTDGSECARASSCWKALALCNAFTNGFRACSGL